MSLFSQAFMKTRIRLLLIATLALAFMTPEALAEGFSVGASIGASKITVDDSSSGIDFDGSDVGWKVFGKFMFNDNLGLEVGYVDFGNPGDSIFGFGTDIAADGIDAFLIGSLPASESVDLFGKVGYVSWDAEISAPGVSESDDGSDLAVGIGAAFHTSDTFSILGEWEWFDIADSDAVWMLSIGIEVGFN